MSTAKSACKLWSGAKVHGYGVREYQGKMMRAHRVAFYEEHGYWPPVVRHTCDTPACVEPTHLLPGTHADNVADRVARGRSKGSTQGRPQKLSWEKVAEIRSRADEHIPSLAREFDVADTVIRAVLQHKIWVPRV